MQDFNLSPLNLYPHNQYPFSRNCPEDGVICIIPYSWASQPRRSGLFHMPPLTTPAWGEHSFCLTCFMHITIQNVLGFFWCTDSFVHCLFNLHFVKHLPCCTVLGNCVDGACRNHYRLEWKWWEVQKKECLTLPRKDHWRRARWEAWADSWRMNMGFLWCNFYLQLNSKQHCVLYFLIPSCLSPLHGINIEYLFVNWLIHSCKWTEMWASQLTNSIFTEQFSQMSLSITNLCSVTHTEIVQCGCDHYIAEIKIITS